MPDNKALIQEKIDELIESIKEYESDTFSSSGEELTEKEAQEIAFRFIIDDIQSRIDTNTMDGVMISEELENIRETD